MEKMLLSQTAPIYLTPLSLSLYLPLVDQLFLTTRESKLLLGLFPRPQQLTDHHRHPFSLPTQIYLAVFSLCALLTRQVAHGGFQQWCVAAGSVLCFMLLPRALDAFAFTQSPHPPQQKGHHSTSLEDIPGGSPVSNRYLAAIYFAVSVATTTGFGDIIPFDDSERLYMIFGMLFAALIFGYTVGSVSSVYGEIFSATVRKATRSQEVNQYLADINLPPTLARRLRHYFSKHVVKRAAYNEERLLASLSESLKREVILYLKRDIIDSIPFLRNFVVEQHSQLAIQSTDCAPRSPSFPLNSMPHHYVDLNVLYAIVSSVRPLFALPGDYFFHQNDMSHEMFFVVSGRLQLLRKPAADHSLELPPKHSAQPSLLGKRASTVFRHISSMLHISSMQPHTALPFACPAEDIEVGIVEPGGFYGEAELILSKPFAAAGKALTQIEAYTLSRSAARTLIFLYPSFGENLARNILKVREALRTKIEI